MKKYSEFSLIHKIKEDFKFEDKNVIGIGDDCAFLAGANKNLLFTTDALVENKHFIFEKTDFFLLGRKSLAVNISDIAAMGGEPLYFLLTLGIPAYMEDVFIEKFLDGLKNVADLYKIRLIGGDCVASDNFFVSITLIGKTMKNPILRSGAKAHDYIYVTGSIGDSFFGLSILLGEKELTFKDENYFVKRHLDPEPKVKLMSKIVDKYVVNSAIDVSDGMLGDLIHIAEESKCGFELFLDKVPLSKDKIGDSLKDREMDYILKAISGGEDYEIIFTSPDIIKDKDITMIGKILDKDYKIFYKDKEFDLTNIKYKSFIHF